ncbi:MAG: GSCFA domain-containing protein [Chitinophagaceae bacterium]|nr:GSCFA domain-containing protein [Chitinophagaceae bacterium]
MNFLIPIHIPSLQTPIQHKHQILLTGSCFTEHMSNYLSRAKIRNQHNSHGIMFNPLSLCVALQDVIDAKKYAPQDLFFHNEYWHSWNHHSDFSFRDPEQAIAKINNSIQTQHEFLKQADYLILTLGSAFAYYHLEENRYVSNNHRTPLHGFRKDLLTAEFMMQELQQCIKRLNNFNPKLQCIVTISPVRHTRDGVIENNRSKARLLETVHALEDIYYFPSYEIMIDVLRDYRFYDSDLVHPNYQATQYIWEQFLTHCLSSDAKPIIEQCEKLYKALHHKPKDKQSQAHQDFKASNLQLCLSLKQDYPYIQLQQEIAYFS